MPPANRHQPRRAQSSTSEYTLTQFQRGFPDNAACLEHLWRTRHSSDGEHAHCPRCDCRRVFKRYETKQRRQSWTCTDRGDRDSVKVYVRGNIHTNTIEGFFGNLKTGMRGTCKQVSRKWLRSYPDGHAWRYSQRREPRGMFFALLDNAAGLPR